MIYQRSQRVACMARGLGWSCVRHKHTASTQGPHPLPPWPKSPNPTPYEIFGTSQSKFEKARVKSMYMQMARIYHPDSKIKLNISTPAKVERFKKIVAAYSILKDDRKRAEWNMVHGRFSFDPSMGKVRYQNGKSYGPVGFGATASRSTDGFEFDDFVDEEARRRQNDKDFQEKLRKNRNQLTVVILGAVLVVGYLQVSAITKMSEKRVFQENELSFRTKLDELNAQTNYGRGSMQDERIARFLQTRQTGSYYYKPERQLAIEAPKADK